MSRGGGEEGKGEGERMRGGIEEERRIGEEGRGEKGGNNCE